MVWKSKERPAEFTLPLGAPAKPLPAGKSFGVKRVFNGRAASQPHTGSDYATPVGTPVLAVADGTVVVAKDLFFEGNAVFTDHGNGLVSMCFHLSEIKVRAGPAGQERPGARPGRIDGPRHGTALVLRGPLARRSHQPPVPA